MLMNVSPLRSRHAVVLGLQENLSHRWTIRLPSRSIDAHLKASCHHSLWVEVIRTAKSPVAGAHCNKGIVTLRLALSQSPPKTRKVFEAQTLYHHLVTDREAFELFCHLMTG